MIKYLAILICLFASLPGLAQNGKRLSAMEVRSLVENARQAMLKERSRDERIQILKGLVKRLNVEYEKGSASFDETFVEVNSFIVNIEHMINTDCAHSHKLISSQNAGAGDPNGLSVKDRKAKQYHLQIHAALCRKD